MNEDVFPRLLELVQGSRVLSSRQRHDIEALLQAMYEGFGELVRSEPQGARSASQFLSCAIWESARDDRSSALAMAARKGMLLSFRPFEESFPPLVANAYTLGDVLSALGV